MDEFPDIPLGDYNNNDSDDGDDGDGDGDGGGNGDASSMRSELGGLAIKSAASQSPPPPYQPSRSKLVVITKDPPHSTNTAVAAKKKSRYSKREEKDEEKKKKKKHKKEKKKRKKPAKGKKNKAKRGKKDGEEGLSLKSDRVTHATGGGGGGGGGGGQGGDDSSSSSSEADDDSDDDSDEDDSEDEMDSSEMDSDDSEGWAKKFKKRGKAWKKKDKAKDPASDVRLKYKPLLDFTEEVEYCAACKCDPAKETNARVRAIYVQFRNAQKMTGNVGEVERYHGMCDMFNEEIRPKLPVGTPEWKFSTCVKHFTGGCMNSDETQLQLKKVALQYRLLCVLGDNLELMNPKTGKVVAYDKGTARILHKMTTYKHKT